MISQCCKHLDLAMVFGYAIKTGLSKAKLVLDDKEWVLNFGLDVGLPKQKPAASAVSFRSCNRLS